MKIPIDNERAAFCKAMTWLLPLLLSLSGCGFNHSAVPPQLVDLGPNLSQASLEQFRTTSNTNIPSEVSANTQRHQPVALSFSGSQILTGTSVIWRTEDSSIVRTYATYHWAAPPLQLVEQRTIERLSTARAVVQNGADPFVPLLQISLTRFEQVYASDGKSSVGLVSMRAVLVRNHQVENSILLTKSVKAPSQDASGGVIALRAATAAITADLSIWLQQSLDSSTSSPPNRRTKK